MFTEISSLIRYYLATLGYYGAWSVAAGSTATCDNGMFAIKTLEDSEVVCTAIQGSDITVTLSKGDIHYGNYKSVEVVSGNVIVYPISSTVNIA
jgi:hypothetical protein